VPDYGYYNRLFDPAFQHFLPALNLHLMPVTALSSGRPFDFLFRSNLPGRSFRSAIFFNQPFGQP
jgi:hypothetical protein